MIALIKSLSTRGDAGVACLAYGLGAFADAFLFPGGLEAPRVALFSAIGALGAKKIFEPLVAPIVLRWISRRRLRRQATALLLDQQAADIERVFGLWSAGAIDDDHMRTVIETTQDALIAAK